MITIRITKQEGVLEDEYGQLCDWSGYLSGDGVWEITVNSYTGRDKRRLEDLVRKFLESRSYLRRRRRGGVIGRGSSTYPIGGKLRSGVLSK